MSYESSNPEITGIGATAPKQRRFEPPPEGHASVGPWVNNQIARMLSYRKKLGIDDLLTHNHELYRGKFFQLKTKYPQVPVNLIWKTINTLKGNLTDNKPRATIQGRNGSSDLAGNAWQAAYDEWWDLTSQQRILQESVGLSELYGFQVEKMIFNPDLDGGLGEIETVLCDSFGILLWPGCVFDIQKSPMIAHLEAMEIGEIYRRWPDAKGKVKSDPNLSLTLGESRKPVRGNRMRPAIRPVGSGQQYPGTFKPIEPDDAWDFGEQDIPKALVIELWVKDYTMEYVNPLTGKATRKRPKEEDLLYPEIQAQPVPDPMTGQPMIGLDGQPMTIQVPVVKKAEPVYQSKYPGFIRCIHVTNSGKLVLDDLPNPSINPDLPREMTCQSHLWDKFPFNRRLSYSDGLSEYGLCIIEQIEPLVLEISKKVTKIAAHLDVACLPPLILPRGCGIDRRQINNLPDRIWEATAGVSASIRFLQLPTLPQDYGLYIQLLIRLVDMVTGLTDVSEGRKPGGITANSAIRSLQEKAQVVFREKIRNVEVSEVEKGRMFISLAQNWYTRERKLKYFGEQGEQEIEFQGVAEQFQGEFAFKVETGSTLPTDRWAMQQLYMQLAQSKFIDLPALLEMLNIPKRDEIVQRMMQGPMRQQLMKLQRTQLFDPKLLQAITSILALPQKDFEKAFPQAQPLNIAAKAVQDAGLGQGVTGLPNKKPQIVANNPQPMPQEMGM